ncbi:MAG TPA: rhomboid family intramembrane serine protease, partial [Bacteroidetes bacterium]|nr:rhomboid family intramembrane serine protease [Bacteroidota bacterium]
MRYSYETVRLGLGGSMTPGVKWLLIANGAVYLIQLIVGPSLIYWFGLSSQMLFHKFAVWQLVTYMFLHGGFFHIFFNLFVLWIFGCEVERDWGTRQFLRYYFVTGIGAGLVGILFSWETHAVIIGASGAIYGIMLAFGMMYPERIITLLIFFVLPVSMKAKHLVMMMALISIFSGVANLFGTGDGVAHFAHLGGMAVGYLYLKSDWRFRRITGWFRTRAKMRRVQMQIHQMEKEEDLQRRVDEILDKINRVGYENLTRAEKN